MKRGISTFMAVFLLLTCMFATASQSKASTRLEESRAIAIVFDNSGSMYKNGNQAWCRATYAMEVFASMLNEDDILQVYPMSPITVENQTYTMENPLQITDSKKASTIRDIFTPDAGETPIESIDSAAQGLQTINADKKYMIVLTDGGTFSKNGSQLTKENTRKELGKCVEKYASPAMMVMYLGVGSEACIPDASESAYFVKKQAADSADVLDTLTVMCNQIFGRDTLPQNHISGNTVDFDVSMSKLIVFVQGENISNLNVIGTSVGSQTGSQQTKYSTNGAGDYPSTPDTSLQGMMVTYSDCAADSYKIEYTGTATSVEVYYEPDADLEFIFTDSEGNTVASNSLYEGDYKVSFGMKDAKTGKLIYSDLLGKPKYEGSYSINGQEFPIECEGFSGSVDIPLKMEDKFEANLTVTYLSGYTISKDSSDFGWPEDGIQVAPRPAGDLEIEITGGDEVYSLQNLEDGNPYLVKVYYQGEQLTGDELKNVELKWEPETSNAEIQKFFAEDHWQLHLRHKEPEAPQSTACGECTVTIYALYSAQGSSDAQAQNTLTYSIDDDFAPVQIELVVDSDYIAIKDLDESKPIIAKLTIDGEMLTSEQFSAVEMKVDSNGIECNLTANEQDSSYSIKLLPTNGIKEGNYSINVTTDFTDNIGRKTQSEAATTITLSNIPLWARWAIRIIVLLVIVLFVWRILHIKVLPKHIHTSRRVCNMVFDGDDVTQSTNFLAEIKNKSVKVQGQYGGRKIGISMDVKPGRESYLYKPGKRRSAEVKVGSVKKFGPAKIQEAMIGSAKYIIDEDSGKIVPALSNQKPFTLTNGARVKFSGTVMDAGIDKDFELSSQLNFKKK